MNRAIPTLLSAFLLAISASVWAGPYSDGLHGVASNDPRFVGWATGITVNWVNGFHPGGGFDNTLRALGPAKPVSNDVVTLGDNGSAVLTFGTSIRNLPGPDLAVYENGFDGFCELAFVEVSSNGRDYARFPSVSLNGPLASDYAKLDPTSVYNLAGKHVNNNIGYVTAWQGTPFNLDDLRTNSLVTLGKVNLDNINFVRIQDIYGNTDCATFGWTYDQATSLIDPTTGANYTKNNLIYDGGNLGRELAGFDLDAVGVLRPISGDANGDGKIDGADLALWQQHYDPLGLDNNTFGMGDFNGDGKIDGGDLALWQQHYNPIGITGLDGAAPLGDFGPLAPVPEPGTFALLSLAAALAYARRSRRRRANDECRMTRE
jgi:hypothetical protein